jgi:hypothetical protein
MACSPCFYSTGQPFLSNFSGPGHDHANRLVLVLILAYAWMLTVGSYAFDDPALFRYVAKPSAKPFALFRLGLRLFNHLRDALHADFAPIPPHLFFSDPPPPCRSVGA